MPTVVFNPVYGAETVSSSPYTVLQGPNVELIFWGTYWNTTQGQKDYKTLADEAQTILGSTYFGGLSEYGANAGAVYGTRWADINSDPPAGYDPGQLNTASNFSAAQAEVQSAINNSTSPTPPPGGSSDILQSPIYVVVSGPANSNGDSGGYNAQATFTAGSGQYQQSYPINIATIGTQTGGMAAAFGMTFSHEIAERVTDPEAGGVIITAYPPNTPPSLASAIASNQIGDGEQEPYFQDHYNYHLNGATVQSFWSNSYQAFIVPDGNSDSIYLNPIWSKGNNTGNYNLVIKGDQPATGLNDTVTINASDSSTTVVLDGQTFTFTPDPFGGDHIKTITVQLGGGSNVVNLQANAADQGVIIQGAGSDTVNLGYNGSVQGIQGTVLISNPPAYTTVNLDDSQDGTPRTFNLDSGSFFGTPIGQITGLAPAMIAYAYSDISAVNIHTGVGGATVNVHATGVETNLISHGLATVNVGNGGSVAGIQGTLNIENPPLHTVVNVDDSADTTAGTVTLSTLGTNPADSEGNSDTWGQISGLAPANINYEYADTSSLTIQTGSVGGNIVDVLGTGATTNLVSNGAATVNVGNNGSVQGITGDLNIENPPAETIINVDDSSDGTSRTATLADLGTNPVDSESNTDSWGQISGLAPANINYEDADTSNLTIQTGNAAGDVVDVRATAVPTNLISFGVATVNVGNNGSVQGITGDLNIENPPSHTTINVDDSTDGTARTVTLSTLGTNPADSEGNTDSWGQISGLALANINYEYADTNSLTVKTGTASSTAVDVFTTQVTTNLIGNGPTTITVSNGGSVQGIQADLNIESPTAADNTIVVDDSLDGPARTATLTTLVSNPRDSEGNFDPWGQISGLAPANINYEYGDTRSLTVRTDNSTGNVVNLQGTGTITNLVGNANATVNIGSGGFVQGIEGNVNIENPGAATTINVDDSADNTARTVTLRNFTSSNPDDSEGNTDPWGQISGLTSANINYEYTDTANLTISTGVASGTIVDVEGIGTNTHLIGHATTTVNVGSSGSVQGINAVLDIENPTSSTAVNVDDSADSTARTVTLSTFTSNRVDSEGNSDAWGEISGPGPGPIIDYEIPDTSSVTLKTGSGGAVVNVLATGVPTNLVGSGQTTVNVGNSGSVQGVLGALNVENPTGSTALNVDDSADSTARTVTLSTLGSNPADSQSNSDSWGQISGVAPANINYEHPDIASLTVSTGNVAGSVVNLQATGTTTNVISHASTTVNVGSTANTLDPVQGLVTVTGSSSTILNVYDPGTSSQEEYGISATQLNGVAATQVTRTPSGAVSPTQTIQYANVRFVNLYGGSGQDLWTVESTSYQTQSTALYSGSSIAHNPNEIVVENTADVLDDIQGPVAVYGTVYDQVTAYDGLNAVGHTYTLTTGQLTRDGMANISYAGIGGLIVATANNPSSGHSPNTVYVQSLGPVFAQVAVGANDTVTVGQNGSMANILGNVGIQAVLGQVPKSVTLDDSADTTARTVTLGSDPTFGYLVNGLANSSQGRGEIGLRLDPATPVAIKTGTAAVVFQVHDFTNAPALSLDGGPASNTLDYSAYMGDVKVNLLLGTATGFASISNIENVTAGIGNSLLVGNANANVLIGGTGRNILIGGAGSDTLDASRSLSDNILIGGTTDYDANLAALNVIFAEWTRTDLEFGSRFGDLSVGSNPLHKPPLNVLNGKPVLLTTKTVHADTSPDTLIGSKQTDPATNKRAHNWFLADADDTLVNFLGSSDRKTTVR